MKYDVVLGSIAIGLVMVAIGCSKKKPSAAPVVLNYDNLILLDAEDLGEGNIGAAYKKNIIPVLRKYVATPAEIVEDLDSERSSYKVASQGRTYVIFSTDMDMEEGQNWGNATFAIFDIVNRQLSGTPYRFYAINGGNDLGGMFLTDEEYKEALKGIKKKTDLPYLPIPDAPWYGQQHEE